MTERSREQLIDELAEKTKLSSEDVENVLGRILHQAIVQALGHFGGFHSGGLVTKGARQALVGETVVHLLLPKERVVPKSQMTGQVT